MHLSYVDTGAAERSQEHGLRVVALCHQLPLLIATAGAALQFAAGNPSQWKVFADNFAARISRTRLPRDVYKYHMRAAIDMSLSTLSDDARKLLLSFGAWPTSRMNLVRVFSHAHSGVLHIHELTSDA